jgi:adenine-specific DNA-methyltransferase
VKILEVDKAVFESSALPHGDGYKRDPHYLVNHTDLLRLDVCKQLEQGKRGEMGQFLTPAPVARLMASMLECPTSKVSILDAGAGIGSLFSACIAELLQRDERPEEIHVTAYEIDPILVGYLKSTLELCQRECDCAGVAFTSEIRPIDFLNDAVHLLREDLFSTPEEPRHTCAILNPPYKKINSKSETRDQLREIGIETSNLYTGFLAAAVKLLAPRGELVAITPRSFCNGPYFRTFREFFLEEMAIRRLHLFDSRQAAFRDDAVLQETVIVHAVKQEERPERVEITSSGSAEDELILTQTIRFDELVNPDDPERFIRIVPDDLGSEVVKRMETFTSSLEDLELGVSTGKVVDFRAKEYLLLKPIDGAVPLIYPTNFSGGYISWPKETRKPQALRLAPDTKPLLVPNEHYVLVKRFSSKEEKRRIVAAIYDGGRLECAGVGFENHINYFHKNGGGLDLSLARGLSAYLNSTLVDTFFRQFNGHTQVNATDLRSLKYPSLQELIGLGEFIRDTYPTQEEIDRLIERELLPMARTSGKGNPIVARHRIDEALDILIALGLPRPQLNERSALTLLAMLDLGPNDPWGSASNPRRGITPIMEFMSNKYGKTYKPNTRETVRRQTVHQFIDAGLLQVNPDKPERPPNSPNTVYEIEPSALDLLRTYGSKKWGRSLRTYLASVETLKARYAQERKMARIPVKIGRGKTITLSPGGQNILVEQIIKEFAPRFTPGGKLIYVGDTDNKFAHFDRKALSKLGVEIDDHGKIPDVIVLHTEKNWLVLIEAVTSHGPINPKRKYDLQTLFKNSTAGLVYVTAFLNRKAMVAYLPEISWETEVWLAEAPSHIIHFNGERFLGPY